MYGRPAGDGCAIFGRRVMPKSLVVSRYVSYSMIQGSLG